MSIRLSVCFTFSIAPLLALAQSAPSSDDVIVTASRLASPTNATPYPVSTVQQAQLAGRTDVADAITQFADVHVQSPGGRSGNTSIFLRGADPNFTAIMFEGIPLNNPTNTRGGAVNLSGIDAASLQRIELVTGPLSSLYGSGALAGAINLIAPGGTSAHEVHATLGAGTHGYASGNLRWQGPLGEQFGGAVGVASDDDGEQTPDAGFKSRTVFAKVTTASSEIPAQLVARFNETESSAYPDASGGSRLAARRTLEKRKGREQLAGLQLRVFNNGPAHIDISASLLQRHDDTTSPGVARSAIDPVGIPAGTDSSEYRRVAGQFVGRIDLSSWSLAAGVEALRETGTSEGFLDFGFFRAPNNFDLHRSTVSGFAEANRSAGHLSVNAGLRMDDVDRLASKVTARAGIRYAIAASNWSLRAALGSGFKAPSFYALGNPFVGNARLRPESSRGAEAGIQWSDQSANSLAVTLFQNRFNDLIDFVPGPPPRLENRDLVTSKGIDITATRAISSTLSGRVQAVYVQTRDDGTQQQLLNRPEWRGNLGVTWRANAAWNLAAQLGHVGQRDDYAIPVGVQTLDAYNLLSVEAEWQFSKVSSARLVVSNTLNARYEDSIGFPSPGAAARVLLSHTF